MVAVSKGSVNRKIKFTLGPDKNKIKRSSKETASTGSSSTCKGSPNKRLKKYRSSILPIPKNFIHFQLLCNADNVREDKLAEFISDMMRSLGARVVVRAIHSRESVIWLVIVYSTGTRDRTYDLERTVGGEVILVDESVSSAQEALLRTFEFFVKTDPKLSGVMCYLMANTAHMATVKRWQHRINFLSHSQIVFIPLLGTNSNDLLVEFAGDYVAVKNALYYTSIELQSCQLQSRFPIRVQQCVLDIQRHVEILACNELRDAFEEIHKTDSHKHNNSSSDASGTGEKDGVVQITGGITNVEDAISHVTGRLRDNLIFGKADKSPTSSKETKEEVVGRVTPGGLGGPSTYVEGCSSKSSYGYGYGYGYANTENTTYGRITIQDENMGLVANKKLRNLIQLKEISGASVKILGPRLGRANRIIAINGTPTQIQTAEDLYLAFLLNDKLVPDKDKSKRRADSGSRIRTV